MIKIKEFASLCQCSTQTLRYYDQINILSPAYVDDENNYRYYEKNQLFDYIKIKNLQLADFSIDEIKQLLTSSDEAIYYAFDQKIDRINDKLVSILKIKETYHIENSTMERVFQIIKENFEEAFQPELVKQEYNLNETELNEYVAEWESMIINALGSDDYGKGFTQSGLTEEQILQAVNQFKALNSKPGTKINVADYTVLEAFHGWTYLHEIMADLCRVKDGDKIIYCLDVAPEKLALSLLCLPSSCKQF